jgi:hypothetical protein
MYYIKKLQFQELGSPKPDGTVSRGRYMLISKNNDGFFPPLSVTELNDAILLPIIPPDSYEKVYCTYVYHNDKFHGSSAKQPRDEFRLYLNTKIDPERAFFKPDDIIVFEKLQTEDLTNLYKMHRFNSTSEHYLLLDRIIENSEQRGGHATYYEKLDFILEFQVSDLEYLETVIPDEVKKDAEKRQNQAKEESVIEIEETKGANLFNSVSFRDFVLLGYGNKCAITGEAIFYKKLINLEAAHIKPKSHSGSFLPCNGIAMSRDMHWAFDRGMFTINEEYQIIVHPDVKDTLLIKYDTQKITLPVEDFFKPEKAFLNYHKENIFGLFKYAGVMRSPN